MNTAIDQLKQRLDIKRIALAGQSGGSTISASLLSFGRTDITCAALGSGAYELADLHFKFMKTAGSKATKAQVARKVFDPISHVDEIEPDSKRRIFIIGDESDTRTPFDQQKRYAESLKAKGHHAIVIPIEASGDLEHGAAKYATPTAGACLQGSTDKFIIDANAVNTEKTRAQKKAAAPVATSAVAPVKTSLENGK
jgi:acetyl esterase/lipase